MHHPVINACDRLSLTALTGLFQRTHVFIGNDSGPMHLATAAGAPVVALFGPTELTRWQPRASHQVVVKGTDACDPGCRTEACLGNYRCMRSITVDQVETAITSLGAHL
ncbi:MAG: glycosyltransferase family 9 protein [Pseudomonadales bacterium]|nr:glycosyltransferase family 9 protein [Pseudomonadales bacterium]